MITPKLISLIDMRELINQVIIDLKYYPQLQPPAKPQDKIWEYYQLLEGLPIVLESHVVVIVNVPLINKSFSFSVYKACNIPIVHL